MIVLKQIPSIFVLVQHSLRRDGECPSSLLIKFIFGVSMKKIQLGVFIILLTQECFAAYTCTGAVDNIQIGYDGTVSLISQGLYGNGQGRVICSTSQEWKGVPASSCKGWLSLLLSAHSTQKEIWVQYSDANTECSQQPTWGNASRPNAIKFK